jgi:F0F1-type ATP synthase assembly protein I
LSGRPPGILEFAQLGMMGALCLLGGLAAGWGADAALGTLPLFLFVGLVVGMALGATLTWRAVKRWS